MIAMDPVWHPQTPIDRDLNLSTDVMNLQVPYFGCFVSVSESDAVAGHGKFVTNNWITV